MKIYNEIILKWNDDTNSFDTLYEDSFEYDGPMMLMSGDCTITWYTLNEVSSDQGGMCDCVGPYEHTFNVDSEADCNVDVIIDSGQCTSWNEPASQSNDWTNSSMDCPPWTLLGSCQGCSSTLIDNEGVDSISYVPEIVYGCTDSTACNYDPDATNDDGSCEDGCPDLEDIDGCTDSSALNYNPEATVDDGSCEYECLTMCGDVNGDGTVDVLDIVLLMEYIISEGTLPLTGEALACANVNGDGIVDILDVVAMISYVTGQTNNLYCDLSDGPIDPHPLVNDPPVAQITIVQ